MSNFVINELKRKYHQKRIIPFIGAGLSIPFQLKSWENLINELKVSLLDKNFWKMIEFDLENKDYQTAIENIKKYGNITDQEIQEKISDSYSIRKSDIKKPIENNYEDLQKENFKIYITTNYDRLLEDYLPNINNFRTLAEYNSNVQRLTAEDAEKYLFHIHGCVSNPNSIVISEEKYNSTYDEHFERLMSVFSSQYSFLFIGFSFEDSFIKKLVKEHKQYFKGTHYLIANSESLDNEKRRTLISDYGVKIIEYKIDSSSHVDEIRKIMIEITEELPLKAESNTNIISGVGIDELINQKENYEENLFYKKLSLAKISDDLKELSIYFYIAAEKYIRISKSVGIPKEKIDEILAEVFMTYKARYAELYTRGNGGSEELLIEIHNTLETINIERFTVSKSKPTNSENKGFVHILADNIERDVWWGNERI